jgi:hypothetical protein
MNEFIYSLFTSPIITRNYSTIAISTLYNSLSHTHRHTYIDTHTHTHTNRLLVTQLKHRNYNSLAELHSKYYIKSLLFPAVLLQLTLICTALYYTLNSFPGKFRVIGSRLLNRDYLQTIFVALLNIRHGPRTETPHVIVDMFIVLLPSTVHGHIENTSHVIPTQRVHRRSDCCLATSYSNRPIVACIYLSVLIGSLPGNALTRHNIFASKTAIWQQ